MLRIFGCCGALFILATNCVALKIIIKSLKPTFLNFLICVDCCVSICAVPSILQAADVLTPDSSPTLCTLITFSTFFIAMLNGLIPVGIVIYRVIHVCKPTWVMTAEQRRVLNYILLALTLGVSIFLTLAAIAYKDHSKHYLVCIGQLEAAHGGSRWDLPIYHPFHLSSILAFISRTLFVPVGYSLIFWFRNKTTSEASGLSETSRANRRARNAVNAKFNFFIWLSEMSSYSVLIFGSNIGALIFLLISFGISPVLYLSGMEETRVELQDFWGNLI